MASRNYRDLLAWQKAMDLVEAVYRATRDFPREELYALTGQVRRAAVSVPSNIAEGEGRRSRRDFVRYLPIAYGSLRELETQLLIAGRLDYLTEAETEELLQSTGEVGRLLNGLSRSLSRTE
jgi:four helix bundle protein